MCSLCPYLVVKCHYYLKGSVMNAMCIKNYTYKELLLTNVIARFLNQNLGLVKYLLS